MSNFQYNEEVSKSLARLIWLNLNKRAYSKEQLAQAALSFNNILNNTEDTEIRLLTASLIMSTFSSEECSNIYEFNKINKTA